MDQRPPNAYSIERGYYYQSPPASLARLCAIAALAFLALMASFHFALAARLQPAQARGPLAPLPLPAKIPATSQGTAAMNAVVTHIAGHESHISCRLAVQEQGLDILGRARPGGSEAELTREVCLSLHGFARWTNADWKCVRAARTPCSMLVNQSTLALQVLAHEAYHLRGFLDERVVDCYALQSVSYVARTLGASSAEAAAVSRYLHSFYIMVRMPAPGYELTDTCGNGGPLDLRPAEALWPG